MRQENEAFIDVLNTIRTASAMTVQQKELLSQEL